MIRQILCRPCSGETGRLPSEDRIEGWGRREVYISSAVPAGHGIRINGEFKPLADIHCDRCNKPIGGEIAVAVTIWNQGREGEPRQWETVYGRVLTDREVKLADTLARKEAKP